MDRVWLDFAGGQGLARFAELQVLAGILLVDRVWPDFAGGQGDRLDFAGGQGLAGFCLWTVSGQICWITGSG
jgi:hypothetical protein